MANHSPSHYPDIGALGEDLVVKWLQSTGWIILHRRFSCRWGEIDIIAQQDELLAFVEVKTRTAGSWDGGGRYAVAPRKQTKIWRTAEMFLVEYPQKADYSCRFDVAIVLCQRLSSQLGAIANEQNLFGFSTGEYELLLQEYIPAAFDDSTIQG